uniref:Cationic amino acid transporter C-terminal domain-containing protein n=1 Tax=Trichobilharzia regenti TaxID=157069 RepID=A0AA85JJ05_TRIRE|nr:unnamed protein product [Trichobilharzia regenti]
MSDQESDDQMDEQPNVTDPKVYHRKLSGCCHNYGNAITHGLFRKKRHEKDIKQVLNIGSGGQLSLCKLILHGLVSMLDGGIYMYAGIVISKRTGPGAFFAFLLASLVALLNAINYSELACRYPKDNSCYSFTYIIMGELPAFIIGWSLIMDYILTIAVSMRSWSNILNTLTGNRISAFITQFIGRLHSPHGLLSDYPDIVSAILTIILTIICCFIWRRASKLKIVSTVLNVTVVLVTIVYMFVFAKVEHLYTISPNITSVDIRSTRANILPYGLLGLISGTAVCFNVFIGSHAISSRAQEAKNPNYSLAIANLIATFIVGLITAAVALALSMYYPWFYIPSESAFLTAILKRKLQEPWNYVRVVMFFFFGIGTLIGLIASVAGPMVSAIKICCSMIRDGLLPPDISEKYKSHKTPFITIAVFAVISAAFGLIFTVDSLSDFLNLGTLIAYSVNAVSVICLRYRHQSDNPQHSSKSNHIRGGSGKTNETTEEEKYYRKRVGKPGFIKRAFGKQLPDKTLQVINSGVPGDVVVVAVSVYIVLSGLLVLCLVDRRLDSAEFAPWRMIAVVLLLILLISCLLCSSIIQQYGSPDKDLYRVPLVPWIPCLTITINFLLISQVSWFSWARFAVWLFIGIIFYFVYSVVNTYRLAGENDSLPSSSFLSDIEYETRSSKSNSSEDGSLRY